MNEAETEVLIVGGGLAGLKLATLLRAEGIGFHLIEAGDRFGGRISSIRVENESFDLGPAWFWAGQPRMSELVDKYQLQVFDQYANGAASFENENGEVQCFAGVGGMQGSFRLAGGMASLVEAMSMELSKGCCSLGTKLRHLKHHANGIQATVSGSDGDRLIQAKNVILALPPRIAATAIEFEPGLWEQSLDTALKIPTWMAGQAKALAVFDKPFWRDAGLSGTAMSKVGPMIEVHDASPANGKLGALFGFIGVPADHRKDKGELGELVVAQLVRVFGDKAANPSRLEIMDWATNSFVATDLDKAPMTHHPGYGMPDELVGLMEGRLLFASTEVAPVFGGYLEGALEAAENAAEKLIGKKSGSVYAAE